ncbi:MAG TPA: hypothetical protein VH062_24875 [Polyangiaceae bacterium]|nr:hypothetical protein [Polyangiaceae bacterium]
MADGGEVDLLRVAEGLEELPAIAQALASGLLNWSAARELTRVAVAETECAWLDVARGKTVHQLEALVAGKSPGDGPSSAGKLDARRHVLRFEVAPETLALFREAMNKLKRSGTPLDDDSALMLMARHVLGGPADDGRASYQIALSVCPECGGGYQHASGELIPVSSDVVAMAECDGQHIGVIAPPVASAEPARDESAHVGAARVRAIGGVRAKQTVSPATRRAVRRRDHERCVVPGCRNTRFLDVHHVALRSEVADTMLTI